MRWIELVLPAMVTLGATDSAHAESPDNFDPSKLNGSYVGKLSWGIVKDSGITPLVAHDVTIEVDDQSRCSFIAWTINGERHTIGYDDKSCPTGMNNWFCLPGDRIDLKSGELVASGPLCGRHLQGAFDMVEADPITIKAAGDTLSAYFFIVSTAGLRLYEVSLTATRPAK